MKNYSPLPSLYSSGIYSSIPRKSQLIPEAGVGRAHEKGITDAAICAAKILKFMYT